MKLPFSMSNQYLSLRACRVFRPCRVGPVFPSVRVVRTRSSSFLEDPERVLVSWFHVRVPQTCAPGGPMGPGPPLGPGLPTPP